MAYFTGVPVGYTNFATSLGINAAIANGAFTGALIGGITSGNLKGALQGGFSGALFGAAGLAGGTTAEAAYTWQRYAAHAAAGCVSSVAGSGNCGQGAVSAAFGKFATNEITLQNDLAKGVATAVAGGVGSVIAGGKFENGATTAAYGYLFNYCSSGKCTSAFEQAMYDYWPGYKAGTLLYNQTIGDGSWTGWEVVDAVSVGAGAAGKGLQALQGLRAGATGIEFGANANQASHAFRHIDNLGLARDAVATAIRTDMSSASLQVGQGVTRSVTVNGIDLTYRAHRISESAINIGRITGPRP